MWYKPQRDKISLYRTNDIEVLLEKLRSLKIMNDVIVVNNRLGFIIFFFSLFFLYLILSLFFFIWTKGKEDKTQHVI